VRTLLPRAQAIIPEDIRTAMTPAELGRLAELARHRTVLEIGSYMGASTVALASIARKVHAIDPHGPEPKEPGCETTLVPMMENLLRYGVRDRVVIHVGYSTEIVPLFPPGSFDLVFIDGLHDRRSVETDLGVCRRVARSGGRIAFHDYGRDGVKTRGAWVAFGVTEVVDAFAAELGSGVETTDTLAVVRIP